MKKNTNLEEFTDKSVDSTGAGEKAESGSKLSGLLTKRNVIIALAALGVAVIATAIILCVVLLGGNDGPAGEGPEGDDPEAEVETADYSVTLKTYGGMVMSGVTVYMWTVDEDGALSEIADAAVTDANGKATFKGLDISKSYAAKINTGVPKGYDLKDHYPMGKGIKDLKITLKSSLIEDGLASAKLNAGSIMYDFTIDTLDGDEFTLSDVLAEKELVMLNFWYIECPNCRDEFPYMQSVYERYEDDVAILALNPLDAAADSKSYIDNFGNNYNEGKDLTFSFAYDSLGLYEKFFSPQTGEYGIQHYPTTILIDRYGCITLIEQGGLPYEEAFELMFNKHIGDNYVQQIYAQIEDMEERKAPTVEQPSSDELGAAFDKDAFDVTYTPEADDEWAWAFDITEKDGVTAIAPTNKNVHSSYAIMNAEVTLNAGDVLALDYFASTERGGDYLYIIVDGQDIYSISGQSQEWETCYAYVAPEDGTYTVSFCYIKDITTHYGDDTIWLKDFRKVSVSDINKPTYIYRDVLLDNEGNPSVDIFFNEKDGYYHVNSVDGPILLANLMGYTQFNDKNTVYYMAIGKDYEDRVVKYCSYAGNSSINGVCSVNAELKSLLEQIAGENAVTGDEYEWLLFCNYYDAYGTGGKQLQDPIKGLATFSAFEAVESEKGATDFPNVITYDRVIMPRGLKYRFTPETSGVYLIVSSNLDMIDDYCQAWIFDDNDNIILEYHDVDRNNQPTKQYYVENGVEKTKIVYGDMVNTYIMMYMEKGENYYVDIAFGDVYSTGDIGFRIELLGEAGQYRFSKAAYGPLTYIETSTGQVNKYTAIGIDVVLGDDGYYHEARYDKNGNLVGDHLYADFTKIIGDVFPSHTLTDILNRGGFNMGVGDVDADPLTGGVDRTQWVRDYLAANLIEEGDVLFGETITADDPRIGCVLVNETLAQILQELHLKFTTFDADNAWRRFCFYHEYFGPKN